MLTKLAFAAAALVAVVAALLAIGILSNRVPITAPPGIAARLAAYLGRNVAETGMPRPGDADALPELAAIRLAPDAGDERLAERIADVCRVLGWRNVRADAGNRVVRAEVVTPLLRFTDDVTIRLVERARGTEIAVRSASRVGRADLGANLRHVLDLRRALVAAGLAMPGGIASDPIR